MRIILPIGILAIAICMFLSWRIKKGHWHSLMLFVCFPIAQIVLWSAVCWLTHAYGSKDYTVLLASSFVFFVIADTALIIAFRKTENNAINEVKNQQMEELLEIQTQHYDALSGKRDDMDKMRKDVAEAISRMKTFLENGEKENAALEMDALKEKQNRRPGNVAGSTIVESFVEQRRHELEEKGLKLQPTILLPSDIKISDVEMICAVGNLIDNAEEACTGLQNAVIDLCLCPKGDYISIRCENPSSEKPKTDKQCRVPELERGQGLLILKELARQKDGNLEVTTQNGTFCIDLMLKNIPENLSL